MIEDRRLRPIDSVTQKHATRLAMVSIRQWGIALLIWPLVGCDDRSKEMSKLLDQQALILQRLDALEASQARMLAGGVDARRRVDTATYHIAIDDSPSRGRIDAPVTIVQFSDFDCPYCARVVPELEQLVQKYPREVRVVYKQFPLPTHSASRAFAAASLAANEQRRFWQFHDVLFAAARARKLAATEMNEYARQAGLHLERFTRDLESKRTQYDDLIERDIAQGKRLQIRRVPSIFINGKRAPAGTFSVLDAMVKQVLHPPTRKPAS